MRTSWIAAVVAALLVASCSMSGGDDELVVRRMTVTWGLDGSRAETAMPEVPVDVLVETADGYTAIPVAQEAEGVYRLPALPKERHFVRVKTGVTSLVQAEGGVLFLGANRIGRTSATYASTATPISLAASGLDPWQATDTLDLYGPTVDLHPPVTSTGTEGATSATGAANHQYAYLLDASQGDWAIVSQLRRTDLASGYVRKLIRYDLVDGVTMSAGQSTSISATVAAPSSSRGVRMDFRATSFADAVAGAGGVSITSPTYAANVAWHPLASVPGPLPSARPNVLYVTSTADVDLGTVPVPVARSSWGLVVFAYATATVDTPGGSMLATVATVRRRADAATPALEAEIGPVRNVKVDGRLLSGAAVTGVGLTPLVEWDAPAWGAATFYNVNVYRGTTSVLSATTLSRSIRIPPDVLASGNSYWISVSASWAPDWQRATGLPGFPYANAVHYTPVGFTP